MIACLNCSGVAERVCCERRSPVIITEGRGGERVLEPSRVRVVRDRVERRSENLSEWRDMIAGVRITRVSVVGREQRAESGERRAEERMR